VQKLALKKIKYILLIVFYIQNYPKKLFKSDLLAPKHSQSSDNGLVFPTWPMVESIAVIKQIAVIVILR